MFFWPYFTLPFLLKQCIFTFYFAEWYSVCFISYICFWPLQDKPYQDLSYVLHYLGYMGSSCCLLENGGETLIWWKTIPWQISTCWAEGGLWDGPCSCSQGPQWHRVDGGCSRWAWGRTVFMLLWSWVAFGLGGNRLLPIAAAQATCLGEHLLPQMC